MLSSLSIKNIAIIDQLEIDFERGFNVMTGETGAGKTIIVQALGLVLGARANTDFIRTGTDEAQVVATFSLNGFPPRCAQSVQTILETNDIDTQDEEIIVRRVITTQGRSKISINGVPVTLQMLKEISSHLVDVSSQHEYQLLIDPTNHASLIDDFGVPENVVSEYREAYNHYSHLQDEVQKLRDEERESKEKLDFLKYQLDELKAAAPQPGEIEELEERRARLKHAVMLEAAARGTSQLLYESSGSVVETLDHAQMGLSAAAEIDPALKQFGETISKAQAELAEVARDVKDYAEKLNAEPEEVESIEDRLHLLKGLTKKHGVDLSGLVEKMQIIGEEIDRAENFDEILSQKGTELKNAKNKLSKVADELSCQRNKTGIKLSKVVQDELKGLSMGKTTFATQIERMPMESWDAGGPDKVEFFIAPNVGEDLRPLVRTASGGELSRIMLAIKRALAGKANLAATYVFDEVDAGIGGATAEVVGRKLRDVAEDRQVLCITHLPQVASFGQRHYRISKSVVKGRTVTSMVPLKDSERVEEIARMLGGTSISDVTKKHAQELLHGAFTKHS
jgi:DNA repair protein RecN (Recombination protein N)